MFKYLVVMTFLTASCMKPSTSQTVADETPESHSDIKAHLRAVDDNGDYLVGLACEFPEAKIQLEAKTIFLDDTAEDPHYNQHVMRGDIKMGDLIADRFDANRILSTSSGLAFSAQTYDVHWMYVFAKSTKEGAELTAKLSSNLLGHLETVTGTCILKTL